MIKLSMSKKQRIVFTNFIMFEIQHLEEYKKEVKELSTGIILEGSTELDGMPRGNKVGDPTANKAIRLYSNRYLKRVSQTIKSFERVYSKLDKESKIVWDRLLVKEENIHIIAYEENISVRTIQRKRQAIIKMCANELGLISNFDL